MKLNLVLRFVSDIEVDFWSVEFNLFDLNYNVSNLKIFSLSLNFGEQQVVWV